MERKRVIFLADCQSFYASVEKMEHPEYRDKPVVVAGDPARRSGIVLAACPIAKSYGITTAERIGESIAKCPDLVIVRPRMETYIQLSMFITKIYMNFTDLVEPYSIDEQFLDVTGSMHLYGNGEPEALAAEIQKAVLQQTGIYTRFGIGETKVLAKTACDNYAKKNKSGIYTLYKDTLQDTLWQLPIDKLFMAGSRMTRHFTYMGIRTIGELAKTPLDQLKLMMRRRFGRQADIDATLYWQIANGIDTSPVTPGTHQVPPKSVGHMMTLPRDYATLQEIKTIILELTELVCLRCRSIGVKGAVVTVGCAGANYDRPTGFNRQSKMLDATNVTNHIYHAAVDLFKSHWDGNPVRRIGISLTGFSAGDEYQASLFEDVEGREKLMALEKATDALKRKYGDTAILRAVSLTTAGQAQDRAAKIGGHYK